MRTRLINANGAIELYKNNAEDRETLKPQTTITQQVRTEQTEINDVYDNFSYHEDLSSSADFPNTYDKIFYADENTTPQIMLNGAGNTPSFVFGAGTYISGNTAAVSVYEDGGLDQKDNFNGVLMLESGSTGWTAIDHLTVSSSEGPPGDTAGAIARSFSYDRKNGRHVIFGCRFYSPF